MREMVRKRVLYMDSGAEPLLSVCCFSRIMVSEKRSYCIECGDVHFIGDGYKLRTGTINPEYLHDRLLFRLRDSQ